MSEQESIIGRLEPPGGADESVVPPVVDAAAADADKEDEEQEQEQEQEQDGSEYLLQM